MADSKEPAKSHIFAPLILELLVHCPLRGMKGVLLKFSPGKKIANGEISAAPRRSLLVVTCWLPY